MQALSKRKKGALRSKCHLKTRAAEGLKAEGIWDRVGVNMRWIARDRAVKN